MSCRVEPEEPIKMMTGSELLHILRALALTNCDPRTLGIVAEATGLGDYWPKPVKVEVERPVYLLSNER
jgi:hypothetical protein